MPPEFAIQTQGLTKEFDAPVTARHLRRQAPQTHRHRAVSDIDLTVTVGEVYGLIGPNGAGKTTLIRLLATAETPTLGEIHIFGQRLEQDERNLALKRRINLRNLAIVFSLSLFGQLLLLLLQFGRLPSANNYFLDAQNVYCSGPHNYPYSEPNCLVDGNDNFVINWPLWWQDLFILISIFSLFILLVSGSYLIINDLSKEERLGTLNFIRLSPQPAETILWGKLLGVPILFYLMLLFTMPLSIYGGLAAGLSPVTLVCYYCLVAGSCLFFFSLSLLFGLVTTWLGGFQAWLGSGTLFMLLFSYTLMNIGGTEIDNFAAWPRILFPTTLIPGIEGSGLLPYDSSLSLSNLTWFYLPIGVTTLGITLFALIWYGVGTVWIWRVLKRRFRALNTTILTKPQSYVLTALLQLVMLGFIFQDSVDSSSYRVEITWIYVLVLNLMLGVFLIGSLMPQRATLIEWARYRYIRGSSRAAWLRQWLKELLWSEKSPAFLALAVNILILAIVQLPWIGFTFAANLPKNQGPALIGTVFALSILLIYGAIVQLCLLAASPRRTVWAASLIIVAITLPPIVFGFLGILPDSYAGAPFWLFTAFPWVAAEKILGGTLAFAGLTHGLAIVLLNLQFVRQLRRLGESASKALLTPAPVDKALGY